MLRNYIKIAFRNLLRNKGFSIINISGLAIGMASAILILLWVQNELSFDRFYHKADRLYSLYNRDKINGELHAWNSTPKIMAPTLKKDYPEVEDATRFRNITFLVSEGEKRFNLRGAFTDSSFLTMFSFPMLKGNPKKALSENNSIVLTQKLANKLFGEEEAMGKTVRIDSNANFIVTGILKDLPENTSFEFEYLLPWAFLHQLGWDDTNWDSNSINTYVLLKSNSSQVLFDKKVKDITISHSTEKTEVFTQSINRLHLYSKDDNGKLTGGQIEVVRLFSIIAAFILLIACINFMNLSTARSEKRAKEVGIRKVAGAYRFSLITQFIGESILLSGIAFILAIVIVQISLPGFNQLTGTQVVIDYASPVFWLFSISFILFTGILAGSYPAFYLSSFLPVTVLKGRFKSKNTLLIPRKLMVIMQFTIAITLIISTVIVINQIQYVQNRDAGYDRSNLIYTYTQGDADRNYQLIKQDLIKSGVALSVTKSANPITQRWGGTWGFSWMGCTELDKKLHFVRLGSDADFVETIGVTLLEGRDIDIYRYKSDSTSMLLNESAVIAMRLKNPIGQLIKSDDGFTYTVVGIVKDFVLESPFEKKISPMMITGPTSFFQIIHCKLNPANTTGDNLKKATQIFKKYNPEYPFDYVFTNESYAKKFKTQQRTGKLSALFAGLTIFLSCLGLFGLASFMAESRIKEIGIRKILGATVTTITTLLSKDFLLLVLIAFLIASPVAWFVMQSWLENYSYRINIEWWVFAGTGILSLSIAFLTVSYQAIKAAIANPVKSLRTE